jgi:hypothetical protein
VLIETRRDERINLGRDYRKGKERRAEQRELDLCNQKFLRCGVDQFDLRVRARGKLIGKQQDIVDVFCAREEDNHHHNKDDQRFDEPRAQLN